MITIIVVLGVLLLGYFLFKKKISKVNEVDVKEIGVILPITPCCEAKAVIEAETEASKVENEVDLPIQEKIEEAKAVKIEDLKTEDEVDIKEIGAILPIRR